MALPWAMAGLSFGKSLLGGFMSSRAAVKQFARQHGQNVYNAHFNKLRIKSQNEDTVRIFQEKLKQSKMQMEFNASAAGGAYANVQRNLNNTYARAAFAREKLQQRLGQIEGMQAAKGGRGSSRSADRANLVNSLGNFGREQAKITKSLAGARMASKEQIAGIGRKHLTSDFNAWARTAIAPRLAWHGGDARMGSTSHLQGSPLSLLSAGLDAASTFMNWRADNAGSGVDSGGGSGGGSTGNSVGNNYSGHDFSTNVNPYAGTGSNAEIGWDLDLKGI